MFVAPVEVGSSLRKAINQSFIPMIQSIPKARNANIIFAM
jgi:hypothetical protein